MTDFKIDNAISNLYRSMRGAPISLTASEYILDQAAIDEYYRQHRFIQNMVNLIPNDCNLQLPMWDLDGGDTGEIRKAYLAIEAIGYPLQKIDIQGAFELAMAYARLYGDGFIFIGVNDGQDTSKPVDLKKIRSVDWLAVKHRYEVGLDYTQNCFLTYVDPLNSRLPSSLKFHSSRVMRFSGIKIYGQGLANNGGFNDSIIDSVYKTYQIYMGAVKNSGNMIASHSIFKYKLKGLRQILGIGQEAAIRARFESIMEGLATIGGLVCDGDGEEAEFITRNYGGVKDILQHLQEVFIGVSGMPRSKLFGNASITALSEGSDGDRWIWNEIIARNQANNLKPNQLLLTKYLLAALGSYNTEFDIKYHPHYQLTEKELAELKKINSETDRNYHAMGLPASTILESRFGGADYGQSIILNERDIAILKEVEVETREQAKEAILQPQVENDPKEKPSSEGLE